MDFALIKQPALLLTTYLTSITMILLLTGTTGIVSNRTILTDGRNERKYLEKKYNELLIIVHFIN